MSYSFSKTFSRVVLPEGVCPKTKYKEVVDTLIEQSLRDWFSDDHLLNGHCLWEELVEMYADEDQTIIHNIPGAAQLLREAATDCLSIRLSSTGRGFVLQVYRDSDTHGDEVHDWVLESLLKDKNLALSSVNTTRVVEDSREGTYAYSYRHFLNSDGKLDYEVIEGCSH